MKYHILHDFRTSTSFKEKSSDNSDVNVTSLPGGDLNQMLNTLSITPHRNEVKLSSKFVRSFTL